ncbi:MAG TPA: HRDC domain-containing protein [Candidatus Acidoferrales bacterium]|nr:HRDC domain-containing protein [Candidatus Acidoferrales bacterium]
MISTPQQLAAFLPVVRSAAWLAVDTEADSLHAYPEKVCLIQISTAEGDRLVDPLAGIDLAPFLDALAGRELIFHAADYDLRLLRKHHEFTPSFIFDTMLAARLLGERQFGLSSLVKNFLGVTLDKGSQKADWARRPLTDKMVAYARNDTHYLKPLEEKLSAQLRAKSRLAWHKESCARLIVECSRPVAVDEETVWRVKGSSFLDRAALAVLRELWRWREREALAANRPPFFVLTHERLVAISIAVAEKKPVDHLLPLRLHPRRKDTLFAAIRVAQSVPPEKFPDKIRHRSLRPSEAEFRRFRELEKRRDQQAHLLGIDPTIIAPKSVLGDLARDWEKHAPELMNWQRELLQAKP